MAESGFSIRSVITCRPPSVAVTRSCGGGHQRGVPVGVVPPVPQPVPQEGAGDPDRAARQHQQRSSWEQAQHATCGEEQIRLLHQVLAASGVLADHERRQPVPGKPTQPVQLRRAVLLRHVDHAWVQRRHPAQAPALAAPHPCGGPRPRPATTAHQGPPTPSPPPPSLRTRTRVAAHVCSADRRAAPRRLLPWDGPHGSTAAFRRRLPTPPGSPPPWGPQPATSTDSGMCCMRHRLGPSGRSRRPRSV